MSILFHSLFLSLSFTLSLSSFFFFFFSFCFLFFVPFSLFFLIFKNIVFHLI